MEPLIKAANEINNDEIEEIEDEVENGATKKQSVGSEGELWTSSDESLENEENYVRELASIAAGRSASIAIAGISGSAHHAGGGLYSTHIPTSQLSLMKEKAAAAAPAVDKTTTDYQLRTTHSKCTLFSLIIRF